MSIPKPPVSPSAAALALCEAILPPGDRFLAGLSPARLHQIYGELARINTELPRVMDSLCRALDLVAVTSTGRRFQSLPAPGREALLQRWNSGRGRAGQLLSVVSMLLKLHFFDAPEVFAAYGVPYDKAPAVPEPLPRYIQEQSAPGHEVADQPWEAEVVVVGSGAAGAIVAKELAERGHAVLLVEAGKYYRRHQFSGRFLPAALEFYHWRMRNHIVGNCFINLPTGRMVGGSTTINTATSFRPPPWVHRRWVKMGLPMLSLEAMTPVFDDVEAMMQIAPVPRNLWGPHVELMSRLLDQKGISHRPIRRNAPDCDGQNACDMGCPSGGKYSMDLACVPMALRHGAFLLTETELRDLHIRNGQVRGVTLESGGRRFTVQAPHVVLCCGSMATPEILWDHDLGGPNVGKYLTIQPSISVSARFPQVLHPEGTLVPSSHTIDEHQDRRLMYMSANIALDMGAMPLQVVGRELIDQMENYQHFGSWGVLLAEENYSRLVRLPGGQIATSYFMTPGDAKLLRQGLVFLCELYLEAGATTLFPSVRGWPRLKDPGDVARLADARIPPADLLMTAYHPLGTCRMGTDPATSVVDPEHRVRGVKGLYIVDGSVVPGPLGVNSQETVMGFALRGARILDQLLEAG